MYTHLMIYQQENLFNMCGFHTVGSRYSDTVPHCDPSTTQLAKTNPNIFSG